MATYESGLNNQYKLRVVTTPGVGNIAGNYTPVRVQLILVFGGKTFNGNIDSGYLRVNGTNVWTAPASINLGSTSYLNSTYEFYNQVINIPHNADGTKTFNITAYFSAPSGGWGPSGLSINENQTLTTIPRASSIGTIIGNQLGSQITVAIDRKATTFTHQVWWRVHNDQTWQDLGTGHTTSARFTPAVSLASYNTKGTQLTLQTKIQTYSGTTKIGGEVTKNFTINIPESVLPSFTSISHSEEVPLVSTVVGAYVQNKSRIRFSIVGAQGIHGSTITKHAIYYDGVRVEESSLIRLAITSGSITCWATVWDSRGRSYGSSVTVTVLPYTPPKINSVAFRRCTSTGSLDPNGTYVRIDLNATVSSLKVGTTEKNWLGYRIQSKRTDESSFVQKVSEDLTSLTYNSYRVISGYPNDYGYNFKALTRDALDSWATVFGMIPTGQVLMHWARNVMSVGKMIDDASKNLLVGSGGIDSEGPIRQGGVPLFESGSNGWGNYLKFSDGTQICYKTININLSVTTAWGSLYHSGRQAFGNYAQNFIEPPIVTATINLSTNNWAWLMTIASPTISSFGDCVLVRPTSASSVQGQINLIAIGKWK